MSSDANGSSGGRLTVAAALGEILWLFSQSALHRQLKIERFESAVMPAVMTEQFRIFRFGPLPQLAGVPVDQFPPGLTREGLEHMPLGVALWAELSEAAEAKLNDGKPLAADEWRSGDRLWLLELISPFGNPENQLTERMFADLLSGPFAGRDFKLHRTDPKTGEKVALSLQGLGKGLGSIQPAPV